MRYTPNVGGGLEPWSPTRRPPLDAMPADIAAAAREIDQLNADLVEAGRVVSELKDRGLDQTAKAADQLDAVKAARTGKPMPPAKHRDALAAKRADATRRHEALIGALEQAVTDGNVLRWNRDTPELRAAVNAAHTARREQLLQLAAELGDHLAAAIAERAAADWYRTGSYQAQPTTWWSDINPALPSVGINRDTGGTVDARTALRDVITAVMETPEENQ